MFSRQQLIRISDVFLGTKLEDWELDNDGNWCHDSERLMIRADKRCYGFDLSIMILRDEHWTCVEDDIYRDCLEQYKQICSLYQSLEEQSLVELEQFVTDLKFKKEEKFTDLEESTESTDDL